jgi:hypothetical protein
MLARSHTLRAQDDVVGRKRAVDRYGTRVDHDRRRRYYDDRGRSVSPLPPVIVSVVVAAMIPMARSMPRLLMGAETMPPVLAMHRVMIHPWNVVPLGKVMTIEAPEQSSGADGRSSAGPFSDRRTDSTADEASQHNAVPRVSLIGSNGR